MLASQESQNDRYTSLERKQIAMFTHFSMSLQITMFTHFSMSLQITMFTHFSMSLQITMFTHFSMSLHSLNMQTAEATN
jgi:hypothetical protein